MDCAETGSADAALPHPWAIFAVCALGVTVKPASKFFQPGAEVAGDGTFSLPLIQALKQGAMFQAMAFESGKFVALHQTLLAGKVLLSKGGQVGHTSGNGLLIGTVGKRGKQLVESIHERCMLVVHGFDANRTGVTPHQGQNKNLRQAVGG